MIENVYLLFFFKKKLKKVRNSPTFIPVNAYLITERLRRSRIALVISWKSLHSPKVPKYFPDLKTASVTSSIFYIVLLLTHHAGFDPSMVCASCELKMGSWEIVYGYLLLRSQFYSWALRLQRRQLFNFLAGLIVALESLLPKKPTVQSKTRLLTSNSFPHHYIQVSPGYDNVQR